MGMTIADNIDFMKDAIKLFEDIANNPGINETVKTHFTIESLESAIDIMRKYQKIEQIMEHWVGTQCVEVDLQTLFKIREILEDGNDERKSTHDGIKNHRHLQNIWE